MAAVPNYASTPTVGAAVLTLANGGTKAAPTNAAAVFTPGANGAEIERIVIESVGSVVAGTVQFYRLISSVYYLYTEVQLNVVTAAANVAAVPQTFEAVDNPNWFPIAMPAGSVLYAVLSAAQTGIVVQVEGGSY